MRLCYHMFVLIHLCRQPGRSINKGIVPDKQQCRFALLHIWTPAKTSNRGGGGGGGGGESYLGHADRHCRSEQMVYSGGVIIIRRES